MGRRRRKNRGDTREKEIGTRSIYPHKKESDQKQETKRKREVNGERGRGRRREKENMLEETCATRSIHVTEKKSIKGNT